MDILLMQKIGQKENKTPKHSRRNAGLAEQVVLPSPRQRRFVFSAARLVK